MLVQYRYSETDFVAYLLTLGLQYDKIETSKTKQGEDRAFVYFTGESDYFIEEWNKYKNNEVNVKLSDFSKNRKYISKLMQASRVAYQAMQARERLNN